jgi:hypothetical protein
MRDRKEQTKNINLKQRLATVGLFAMLLILTLCSVGAMFIIWQTTSQASEAVMMSNLYQQAHYQLLSQDAVLQEYLTSNTTTVIHSIIPATRILCVMQYNC